jgi:hypothetical protein
MMMMMIVRMMRKKLQFQLQLLLLKEKLPQRPKSPRRKRRRWSNHTEAEPPFPRFTRDISQVV